MLGGWLGLRVFRRRGLSECYPFPVAADQALQVVVFGSEGYTSSLAAAALQYLGLRRATDMVVRFHAWSAAGLPIVPPGKASKTGPAE
jgi:rhodanese-related sulfurtransferase